MFSFEWRFFHFLKGARGMKVDSQDEKKGREWTKVGKKGYYCQENVISRLLTIQSEAALH